MGAILTYFRAHRWQRRVLTVLLAAAIGSGGAVLLHLPIRRHYLLRDLGSPDPLIRAAAIERGVWLGKAYPQLVGNLNDALDSADDAKFHAISRVLIRLGAFRVAGRDPNQIDRLQLIEFTLTRPGGADTQPATDDSASRPATGEAPGRAETMADTRLLLFHEAVFTGRDNPYIRRLLAAAASDESPAIRQASAILAARLRDAETLKRLLADPDPNVVQWAAIDAGLGQVRDLQDPVRKLFLESRNPEVISGCAYAVAEFWRPWPRGHQGAYDPQYAARFKEANESRFQARILFAANHGEGGENLTAEEAGRMAREIGQKGGYLPEMLMAYASREDLKRVFDGALSDPNGPTRLQVLAAMQWEGLAEQRLAGEMDAIIRRLWGQDKLFILLTAARNLGAEIESDPNAAAQARYIDTLRQASLYPAGSDPNLPDFALAVPAAAAAVALWLREPSASFLTPVPPGAEGDPNLAINLFDADSAAYLIYRASCAEHQLVADYIAWHLARSGRQEAFELGMDILTAPPDPRSPAGRSVFRNYSVNSRCTGAMLLALSARTADQKRRAVARISARLEGGPLGAPGDFFEIGTYQCALLILGENRFAPTVRTLLSSGAFPARRAVTALCAAGDRAGLDWLLWELRASARETGDIIIGSLLGEVLAVLVPELPAVDAAADDDLRDWQVRILQDYYRIHRESIRFAPRE